MKRRIQVVKVAVVNKVVVVYVVGGRVVGGREVGGREDMGKIISSGNCKHLPYTLGKILNKQNSFFYGNPLNRHRQVTMNQPIKNPSDHCIHTSH